MNARIPYRYHSLAIITSFVLWYAQVVTWLAIAIIPGGSFSFPFFFQDFSNFPLFPSSSCILRLISCSANPKHISLSTIISGTFFSYSSYGYSPYGISIHGSVGKGWEVGVSLLNAKKSAFASSKCKHSEDAVGKVKRASSLEEAFGAR